MKKISAYSLFLIFIFINQGFSQDTVAVISPNGGESWVADSTHTITWSDNFDWQVKIELFKGGVFRSLIKNSTISNGVYEWEIDKSIPSDSDYTVKISSTTNSNVLDFSDENFTIIANEVTVTSPNGGEDWKAGTTQTITWTDNFNGDVWINLYKGPTLHTIIVNPTPSDGFYNWTIPFDITGGSDYSIRIANVQTSSVVFDNSDNNFTITPNEITVTSPNGGEIWSTYVPQTITWNDNLTGSVKIELFQGGKKPGDLHSLLTSSTPSSGSFLWNVNLLPDVVPGNDYLIKITSNDNINVLDFSDTTFTFIKEIKVLSPDGGEEWLVGSQQTIGWTDNITENVSIDLYKSDTLYTIVEFATGSDGSKSWDIPDSTAPGSDYKIKITSVEPPGVFDFSNNNFTIVGFNITVTSPNGGEQWEIGKRFNIVWTDNIDGNVKIDLYKGGLFHSVISTSTTSDGLMTWDIPLSIIPDTNNKIRITSLDDSTLFDFSDGDFTLYLSKITITSPNDGLEIWEAGTRNTITWTDIIDENVQIDLYKNDTLYSSISPSTASDGAFPWNIPAQTEAGSDYKIMIKSTINDIIFDFSGYFTIKTVPDKPILSQNYPNPFNPLTTIRYGIPEDGRVLLEVFDITGQKLFTLVDEEKISGFYEVKFENSVLPSGVYFYRIIAGQFVEFKKMILSK